MAKATFPPLDRLMIDEATQLIEKGSELTTYRLTSDAYFGMLTEFLALTERMADTALLGANASAQIRSMVYPIYDRHLSARQTTDER